MPSDRASSPSLEPRGIKRIQQACLNCRRKKAKCSGEKPICSYCKRLGQDCQYWVKGQGRNNLTDDQDQVDGTLSEHSASNVEDLPSRVAAVESKLDQLINTLNMCLPTFADQENAPVARGTLTTPSLKNTTAQSSNNGIVGSISKESKFSSLPPPEVLESLVDVYFSRCYNQPYSFFHEQSFRKKLSEDLLPNYLVFAVLASGLRFSTDPYFGDAADEATTIYARESWKSIVSEWFITESDPNIYICQSITLLSVIDFTSGRRHPAWLKIGLSIRIAQDLRLMMEPDPALSFADQEEQRRVFWSIYLLDKFCSCGRASPASVIDAHCHVQLPCREMNFRNGEWEKTPTLNEALTPGRHVELGDLALVVVTASIIGKCAQHSIHGNGREQSQLSPWDSKSEFATIYSILLQLETEYDMGSRINNRLLNCFRDGVLDMQIAGPMAFSHALFHMSHCLLQHPFLIANQSRLRGVKAPASFLSRAMQTSRENANAISALIQDTKYAGYPIHFSFMGYCASIATTIHMLYLQDEDPAICKQAVSGLQSSMQFIEDVSRHWRSGKAMLAALYRLSAYATAYKSIATTSSSTEGIDEQAIETMWTAIDYSSMSQDVDLNAATFAVRPPSHWTMDFEQNASYDGNHNIDHLNYLSTPRLPGNDASRFNTALYGDIPGLSPFFGTSPLNFGG